MTELRSGVGRAELVRALGLQGRPGLVATADLLGFVPIAPTFRLQSMGELLQFEYEEVLPPAAPPLQDEKLNFRSIPFLRVVRVDYYDAKKKVDRTPFLLENDRIERTVAARVDLDPPREDDLPQPPALTAWPRLWRVLKDFFRSGREGDQVDKKKVDRTPIPQVDRVDEKKVDRTPIPQVDLEPPRQDDQPQPPALVAWPRLWRVLEDFFRWRREGEQVDVLRLVEEVARGKVIWRLPRKRVPTTARVRLVIDRSSHLVPFWNDQLVLASELLRRLGPLELQVDFLGPDGPEGLAPREVGECVLAVTDLGFLGGEHDEGREAWRRAGERLFNRGSRLRALVPCPPNRWERELAEMWNATDWENPHPNLPASGRISASLLAERQALLLRTVSPAIRVEPGLLRELRQLLGRSSDAGTEADVWKQFPNPSSVAATPPAAVAEWRRRLEQEGLSPELERRLVAVLRRWHEALPPLVLAEELATHMPPRAVGEATRLEMSEFLRAGCAQIEAKGSRGAPAVAAWFGRWNHRMQAEPADAELKAALRRAWKVLKVENKRLAFPRWAGPDLIAALEPAGELRNLVVLQRGSEITLRPKRVSPGGSPLAELRCTSQYVRVQARPSGGERLGEADFLLELGATGATFELQELPRLLRLVSDLETVDLELDVRPFWAFAAGRDRYGYWADLEIGGVVQRMRYIRPGRFAMGSPETEEGRWQDEGPQHSVTLTEGFWLADTPCAQEFWQALMLDNPSRFQSPRRPVEQVSWEEAQIFLKALERRLGEGVEARLPTEAQWEYACRAGTTTSTYAGELEIVGACNGPVLHEIAWYGGNSGVNFELEDGRDSSRWPAKQFQHRMAGTREVARKVSNNWGLYDTLGNVWEWCADYWEGQYQPGEQWDPTGPEMGSSRVIRGGSWDYNARNIRGSARRRYEPGSRDDILGFRFSLGQPAMNCRSTLPSVAARHRS